MRERCLRCILGRLSAACEMCGRLVGAECCVVPGTVREWPVGADSRDVSESQSS
jgi:hypothetical protein